MLKAQRKIGYQLEKEVFERVSSYYNVLYFAYKRKCENGRYMDFKDGAEKFMESEEVIMFIKAKNFYLGKKKCSVKLVMDGYFYSVNVDGVEYKKTPSRIFAEQVFNAI